MLSVRVKLGSRETSQVLLTGGQVFISSRSGFLEDLAIQFTQLKMSEITLRDRKPQMERKEKHKMWKEVYLRVIHGISGIFFLSCWRGARWLSGRVLDSGARGPGFETYRRRVVSLSKTLYSPKVLVNYPGSDGSVPTWLKNCWLGR